MKYYILGITLIIFVGGGLYLLLGSGANNIASEFENRKINAPKQNMDNELQIEDIVSGEGQEAKTGNTVTVHYKGMFLNGAVFDASYNRGEPFSFTIGQGSVIQGWEQGIPGMKVGGKRKLTIPPAMGYGTTGSGPIPPNSTLVFEVELLNVQ